MFYTIYDDVPLCFLVLRYRFYYRSGTVNSKSFVGKVLLELSGNLN